MTFKPFSLDKYGAYEEYVDRYTVTNKNLIRSPAFSFTEYVFALLALLFSTCAGIVAYCLKYQKTGIRNSLSLVDNRISMFPAAMSFPITFISAVSLAGYPAEVYYRNMSNILVVPASIIAFFVIGKIYIPIFHRLDLKTTQQYLGIRFGRRTQAVVGSVYLVGMLLYIPVVIATMASLVELVTGIAFQAASAALVLLGVVYVALGGLRCLVWADVVNCLTVLAGLFAILLMGYSTIGFVGSFSEYLQNTGRTDIVGEEFGFYARHNMLALLIGNFVQWLAICATNQAVVQKALSCTVETEAVWSVYFGGFLFVCIYVLTVLIGLYIAAFYMHCDPIYSHSPTSGNILSAFIYDIDVPGMAGILCAALLAASISTITAVVYSASSVIVYDVLQLANDTSKEKKQLIGQIVCVWYGVICLVLSTVPDLSKDMLEIATVVNGLFQGAMLGIFTMGILCPCSNDKGALIGFLLPMSVNIIMWLVDSQRPRPEYIVANRACNGTFIRNKYTSALYKNYTVIYQEPPSELPRVFHFSYLWVCPLGFIQCVLVGLLASYVTGGNDTRKVDPKLTYPLFDKIFPLYFLPESWRSYLRCGILSPENYIQNPSSTSSEDMVPFDKPSAFSRHGSNFMKTVEDELDGI